ncbi:hypothetical protein SAMN03159496_05715 [Rhizobium sp. NFR07]|nr:hypothetical protein SAMN03159496_05715 [Rhizobium sp. NFR07]
MPLKAKRPISDNRPLRISNSYRSGVCFPQTITAQARARRLRPLVKILWWSARPGRFRRATVQPCLFGRGHVPRFHETLLLGLAQDDRRSRLRRRLASLFRYLVRLASLVVRARYRPSRDLSATHRFQDLCVRLSYSVSSFRIQRSLMEGRWRMISRWAFSSSGSTCASQNSAASAGSTSQLRVLTILSSTFARRRPPRRKYSMAIWWDRVYTSSSPS